MVKGISLFKIPAFCKRRKSSRGKKPSGEDAEDSLPADSAVSCNSHGRSGERSRTISGGSNVSAASCNEVPKKKDPRIRTISGSSGYSTQSEPSTSGQKRRRVRTISGGSNFSGDSIISHLDQLSQRDQLLFQAYRFGGR